MLVPRVYILIEATVIEKLNIILLKDTLGENKFPKNLYTQV